MSSEMKRGSEAEAPIQEKRGKESFFLKKAVRGRIRSRSRFL